MKIGITNPRSPAPEAVVVMDDLVVMDDPSYGVVCRRTEYGWDAMYGLETAEEAVTRVELPSCFTLPQDLVEILEEVVVPFMAELYEQARCWIGDLHWGESYVGDTSWIEELSPVEIEKGLDHHYDGGWLQFVRDASPGLRGG